MAFSVKNNIYWVGKQDWELREFHGSEYSTHRGSSYNSYLIKEEKVVLIDTVWAPYAQEFIDNLEKEIDLDKIDYIIANHGEIDHSGALPALMERIPDTPIYCTANAVKSLQGHFHKDWNFKVVKTGDTLDLGNGKQLVFVEAPMLHWPDSMFTYLTGDAVLFSNDGFGQHMASEQMFNDLVDQQELQEECLKYYANILTPFSGFVTEKIKEVLSFNLPLDMICTSHGIIWRDNPAQIVEQYMTWADNYQENQITLIYDSMWHNTRMMAEAITRGIRSVDPSVEVKMFNLANSDKNDVLTQVFKSKGIMVGSPTVNNGILPHVAALLEEIKGLRFKGKHAAAFGSYGWSGEGIDQITRRLDEAGFNTSAGIKAAWKPDDESLQACLAYGRDIAEQWQTAPAVEAPQPIAADIAQISTPAATSAVQQQSVCTPEELVAINDDTSLQCRACGWIYDPGEGEPNQNVAPGTPWTQVPETFLCPECFLGKSEFDPIAKATESAPLDATELAQQAPLVIVGGGSAAYQLVRSFRQLDQATPVVVLTKDAGADYSKPKLSHGFSGNKQVADLVQNSAQQMAAQFNVTIEAFTEVNAIDPLAKTISYSGQSLHYRDLVLALGASPRIPPVSGDAVADIITLNNLTDYQTYQERLVSGKRVLVIGAGLIGTEIAFDLLAGGQQVWLTGLDQRAIANLLPDFVSAQLEEKLSQQGCKMHLGQTVSELTRTKGGINVLLSNGSQFEVDTVVAAAGLRAQTQLAETAGLVVNRAIVVNQQLQTSEPHIYALGDCAEVEGLHLPFMRPIALSAQVLAKNLVGQFSSLTLPAMPITVKTPAMPIQLAGITTQDGLNWQVETDEQGLTARALNSHGKLVGYVVTQAHQKHGFALLEQLPALLQEPQASSLKCA